MSDATLGTAEVAAHYGVTTETVRVWCRQGVLAGDSGNTRGKPWRICKSALEGFEPPGKCSAPRCIACTIILNSEWCTWDDDNLCDVCQEALQHVCRETGLPRADALAQWVEQEVASAHS